MTNDYWVGVLVGCFATFGFNAIANLVLVWIAFKLLNEDFNARNREASK